MRKLAIMCFGIIMICFLSLSFADDVFDENQYENEDLSEFLDIQVIGNVVLGEEVTINLITRENLYFTESLIKIECVEDRGVINIEQNKIGTIDETYKIRFNEVGKYCINAEISGLINNQFRTINKKLYFNIQDSYATFGQENINFDIKTMIQSSDISVDENITPDAGIFSNESNDVAFLELSTMEISNNLFDIDSMNEIGVMGVEDGLLTEMIDEKNTSQNSYKADLRIKQFYLAKGNPYRSGELLKFRVEIVNGGNVDANNFTYALYVDGLETYKTTFSLTPQYYLYQYVYAWAFGEGPKEFELKADINNDITEISETNNTRKLTYNLVGLGEDLQIGKANPRNTPIEVTSDKNFFIDFEPRNMGSKTTSAFSIAYYIDDELYHTNRILTPFKPGHGYNDYWIRYVVKTEGYHKFKIVVDCYNEITESNEENNIFEETYFFDGKGADIVPTNLTHDPNDKLITGNKIPFEVSLKNVGTKGSEPFTSEIFVNKQSKGGITCQLKPGEDAHGVIDVKVLDIGSKTVEFMVDSSKSVDESDEVHNIVTIYRSWRNINTPTGSISINSDDKETTDAKVKLYLKVSDSNILMRFKNNNEEWTDYETFKPEKDWVINETEGGNIVYVEFKNSDGMSTVYNDSIILNGKKITVQGYVKPILYETHLSTELGKATAFDNFKVLIMDKGTGAPDVLDTVYTDSNGYFESSFLNDIGDLENGYDIFIRLVLEDEELKIFGLNTQAYQFDTDISYNTKDTTLNFGDISFDNGSFNIWKVAKQGIKFYYDNASGNEKFGQFEFKWHERLGQGSSSLGLFTKIDAMDCYDASLILHELGHAMQTLASRQPNGAGDQNHSFKRTTSLGTAYSEGWATFFALAADQTDKYIDSGLKAYSGYNAEFVHGFRYAGIGKKDVQFTVHKTYLGPLYEINPSIVFLDIYDKNNEPMDFSTKSFSEIDEVMRLEGINSIYDFYNKWMNKNLTSNEKIQYWRMFDERKISYDINTSSVNLVKKSENENTVIFEAQNIDDVGIAKVEWYIDGELVPSPTMGWNPGNYIESLTINKSNYDIGKHRIQVKSYDFEGAINNASIPTNIRSSVYGSDKDSFIIETDAILPDEITQIDPNPFDPNPFDPNPIDPNPIDPNPIDPNPIDEIPNGINEVNFNHNIEMNSNTQNEIQSNLMSKLEEFVLPKEKLVIKNSYAIENNNNLVIEFDIQENLDVSIYKHIYGVFDKIEIYNPNNEVVVSSNDSFIDESIEIENATKGNWKIVISPNSDLEDSFVPVSLIVTTRPLAPDYDFPELQNSTLLKIEGTLNVEDKFEVSNNDREFVELVIDNIDNNFVVYDENKALYQNSFILDEGVNNIQLKTSNEFSESKVRNYSITVDTISPELIINGLVGTNMESTTSTFILSGRTSSDISTLTINGIEMLLGCRPEKFATVLTLQKGINLINVVAIDQAGNQSDISFSIEY